MIIGTPELIAGSLAKRSADMMQSLQEKGVDCAAADPVTKLLAARQ